jgi:hypothetical protein
LVFRNQIDFFQIFGSVKFYKKPTNGSHAAKSITVKQGHKLTEANVQPPDPADVQAATFVLTSIRKCVDGNTMQHPPQRLRCAARTTLAASLPARYVLAV